jgi:hypothetical protein
MKQFLAVFTGNEAAMARSEWPRLSEAERQQRTQQGMAGWHAWMQQHQARLVVSGGPLGKTLKVSPAGVAPTRNDLCGYLVITAPSHEAAAALFEGHPHFSIFPGDAVEVLECLPVPSVEAPCGTEP